MERPLLSLHLIMRLELLDRIRRQIQENLHLPPLYRGGVREKQITGLATIKVIDQCIYRDSCAHEDQVPRILAATPGAAPG